MDLKLDDMLDGIKDIRRASTKTEENESTVTFFIKDTNIEFDQIKDFIEKILSIRGIFSFKILYGRETVPFRENERDFLVNLIPYLGSLCEEHEQQFEKLRDKEEKEFEIEAYKRFQLYINISCCANCSPLSFEYSFIIYKDKLLDWLNSEFFEGAFPDGVKILIWSTVERLKIDYNFFDIYKNQQKPFFMIVCEGEINEQDGYLNIISATLPNFEEQTKNLMENLESQKTQLQNIIEKYTYFKNENLRFFPPEFWLDSNTKELGKLNEEKKSILNINDGFLLSIFWVISDKIDYEVDTKELKFLLEKDFEVELILKIENGRLKNEGKTLAIGNEKELIHWYETCLYSKSSTPNMKIIKDTIITAGDANFLSVIQQPEKLIRYYEFHYNNLLAEKLKERSDVVKTFINNSQSLKNKLINDTGEVTKSCINIVTVLLGLLLSFALIYSRSANAGKDFAFFVMVLFSLVYIPINTYRIINIMDLANDTIKCFYQDIGVLNKIYRYDFHEIVNVKSENYIAEKKLKKVVTTVLFIMAGLIVILTWLIFTLVQKSYAQIVFNNFIEKVPFLFIFFIVLVLEVIYLGKKFTKDKKIVDEHIQAKNVQK